MRQDQNRRLHGVLNGLNIMHAKYDLIAEYTNGRTSKSNEMTPTEAESLISDLNTKLWDAGKPMRNKIIHLCCLMGMTKVNGDADYFAIDKWIKAIGSNNPKKKRLNYLNLTELKAVVTQVTMAYDRSK